MQILAGQYKGRRIVTLPRLSYRPTQSRIRKSLFDIVGGLDGKAVLDLYAGSGILGFEAASRGAEEITFVENNPDMVRLLYKNRNLFKNTNFSIKKLDAVTFLHSCGTYDLILADPPYENFAQNNKIDGKSLVDLCLTKVKLHGQFILEMPSKIDLTGTREKIYGDTKLVFWNRT
mgnify:FL=1